MFDVNSATSEPQYQRPEQRMSDIDYIRNFDDVVQPVPVAPVSPVVPAVVPVPTGNNLYGYDGTFAQRFYDKCGRSPLTCRRLDFYGNGIPLGSLCYALAFIIYGFYRCKVYRVNDTFLWSVILLFGGIGQCTAGFLEYCKGRNFPMAIYLCYGFYCLSHYAYYIIPEWFVINQNQTMLYNYSEDSMCAFYAGWLFISFGILLASAHTNCLYVCQCICACLFFLLRTIGEGCDSLGTKRHAAGILQAISGFFSLLVCFSQIINNETFGRSVFPTCPLSKLNDIDFVGPN
jgi:succinate-acetate transporter protein